MLIQAKIIYKPRKKRICPNCNKPIEGKTLRMYGHAEDGDPPYAIYIHPQCTQWKHPKIIKVLEEIES